MPKKPKEFVQLSELPKTDGWKTRDGKLVPFDSLSDKELRDALQEAEFRELSHHNRSTFFGVLAEKLEQEAERRGLEVEHYQTEFTAKNVEARKKLDQ